MIEAKIKNNVSLSNLTTFKIGGLAKYFISVTTSEELEQAIKWSLEHHHPYFILGGGSNTLVSDKGFAGVVIQINNKNIQTREQIITVDAGVALGSLVDESIKASLEGLVWATGIPGTVGGAIRGNAGAYGGEIKDNLLSVECFDTKELNFKTFSNTACLFSYRQSLFKESNRFIIWQAKFALKNGDFHDLKQSAKKIITQRHDKLPKLPSAGCVFKNIIIDQISQPSDTLQELLANNVSTHGKLGAGTLIEQVGLKGHRVNQATVSLEHANFIINSGSASAEDVQSLIKEIKAKIKAQYRLELEEELCFLGF